MRTLVEELAVTVTQEVRGYRRLLGLVFRERARIVRGQVDELIGETQRTRAVASALGRLQASRAGLLAQLGAEQGEERSAMTLDRASWLARGDSGETFRALVTELRRLVGRVAAANDVNRALLGRVLEIVQGSLDALRPLMDGPPTYSAGGRFHRSASPAAALNRTA